MACCACNVTASGERHRLIKLFSLLAEIGPLVWLGNTGHPERMLNPENIAIFYLFFCKKSFPIIWAKFAGLSCSRIILFDYKDGFVKGGMSIWLCDEVRMQSSFYVKGHRYVLEGGGSQNNLGFVHICRLAKRKKPLCRSYCDSPYLNQPKGM